MASVTATRPLRGMRPLSSSSSGGGGGVAGPARPVRWRCHCEAGTSSRVTGGSTGSFQATRDLYDRLAQMERDIAADRRGPATQIARELKQAGALWGFSGAQGVPKRSYTLQELRLNKIEPTALLLPKENYLAKVSAYCQRFYVAGLLGAYFVAHWDATSVFYLAAFSFMGLTVDKVGYNGGLEFLAVDTIGRRFSRAYEERVSRHEAGHFLIAYIMGVLPSGYTLSAWNALKNNKTLSIQAGTAFCDEDFQAEVSRGKLSSSTLDKFCCIALAGVAQEYIDHGNSEGGMNDIRQLDDLLMGLGFSQKKADDQVRWAVLNTVFLLRKNQGVIDTLAKAMRAEAPLSECIVQLESTLDQANL